MAKKKSLRLPAFGSQITTIISVALVLLILGILATAGVLAHVGAQQIKRNMGFVIKVEREASTDEINRLKQQLPNAPFAASVTYASADQILQQETQYLGEDALEILDINPYNPEFEVKVNSAYASADSIESLRLRLTADPAIEEVVTAPSTISNVNFFINRISWILIAIAGALLVISFVLINNTVYLAVYSRRFIIHTMKLVGATFGFIRRPFIYAGAISGFIAGIIADVLILGSQFWLASVDPMFDNVLPWQTNAIILSLIILSGVVICSLASFIATTRYLHTDYDDMFKK